VAEAMGVKFLQPVMQQYELKRTLVIKVATMKIMDDLMEAIMRLPLN